MPAAERLPSNVLRNLGSMEPGKYCHGKGLWLVRRKDGGGQWVYRFQLSGRAREMGLGSCDDVTLAQARAEAGKWRAVVKSGSDPIRAREDERKATAAERPTFKAVAEAAYEARRPSLKGDRNASRWLSPINVHVIPKLGGLPVADINQNDVKDALAPIWRAKPDAAAKALYRTRIVMLHAAAMGLDVDLMAVDKATSSRRSIGVSCRGVPPAK